MPHAPEGSRKFSARRVGRAIRVDAVWNWRFHAPGIFRYSGMDEAVIAARKPCLVSLVEGRSYLWCACGRSKSQPFCDGAHVGSAFRPVKFIAQETDEELLCACKRTKSPPFCDGAHNALSPSYGAPMDVQNAAAELVAMTRGTDAADRARLDNDCFVIREGGASTLQSGALGLFQVIGPKDGAKRLSQFAGSLAPGASPALSFGASDAIIFVIAGSGAVLIGDRRFSLSPMSGAYVRGGEAFCLIADTPLKFNVTVCPLGPLPQFIDTIPPKFDEAVPERVAPMDLTRRSEMGDRFYQVLIDREKHGADITQFIGHIPKSRAAHHRHLYEETLTILSGEGVMWTDKTKAEIRAGDTIFLPRKQSHSVECTSAGGMSLIGAFYPSMSPAINY